MPSRNTLREFAPDNFYHVYNRGVEKRIIFHDEQDYRVFLGLLKKYLAASDTDKNRDKNRHLYKPVGGKVRLLAYCLMPNHFHLLFYQLEKDGITELMRRVSTGYVMYFNDRYHRVGSLFQSRYKASLINADAYLTHISRYIHLNPKHYHDWSYSSLSCYLGSKKASWVDTDRILEIFENDREKYRSFINDYVPTKQELEMLKWQLANND